MRLADGGTIRGGVDGCLRLLTVAEQLLREGLRSRAKRDRRLKGARRVSATNQHAKYTEDPEVLHRREGLLSRARQTTDWSPWGEGDEARCGWHGRSGGFAPQRLERRREGA